MSTTEMPDMTDLEGRLRAALTARAELVRPEDLAPLEPVVEERPRWQSPWALLATAAVVLLVLGVVFRGVIGDPRSDDDIAPRPTEPRLEIPQDIGRDWTAEDNVGPARLDLDGDGTKESVEFLGEPRPDYDGRTRLQTTLSSTGEEAYGLVQLFSTLDSYAFDPIDADGDGDQELLIPFDGIGTGPDAPSYPLVLDLRDGLLVQVAVDQPELLRMGNVQVPDTRTPHYEMVRSQRYWVEDGELWSSRSVNAFASGNMFTTRPASLVLDTWRWTLTDAGLLRPEEAGCRVETETDELVPCGPDERDSLPDIARASTETFGPGEEAGYDEGFPMFDATIGGGDAPTLDVRVRDGGARLSYALDVPDPRLDAQAPTGVFYDGVSLLVSSASDPSQMEVLIAPGDELFRVDPVGDVPLGSGTTDDGREYRTWVTPGASGGSLVTVVAGDDGTWESWNWQMVSRTEMSALPTGTVCFDDVDDPSTLRYC